MCFFQSSDFVWSLWHTFRTSARSFAKAGDFWSDEILGLFFQRLFDLRVARSASAVGAREAALDRCEKLLAQERTECERLETTNTELAELVLEQQSVYRQRESSVCASLSPYMIGSFESGDPTVCVCVCFSFFASGGGRAAVGRAHSGLSAHCVRLAALARAARQRPDLFERGREALFPAFPQDHIASRWAGGGSRTFRKERAALMRIRGQKAL